MTATLFAFLVLSFLVRWIIDRVRSHFTRLPSDVITAGAIVVSVAACVLLDVRAAAEFFQLAGTLPAWADFLFTGLCVAGLSSAINDFLIGRGDSPENRVGFS